MTDTSDIPELEPLEEIAVPPAPAPAAAAPVAAPGVTMPVSLGGLPAPAFGVRAQKEYYRFFFCGLLIFMGCLMPWGPEWEMAGWQTLKGGLFTVIALGIMWSSWVAISHGKFDLSTMRWLILGAIPLFSSVWTMVFIFKLPAVVDYMNAAQAEYLSKASEYPEPWHVTDWSTFFRNLTGFRTPEYGKSLSDFIRAVGAGQFFVLFGSLLAEFYFIKGIFSGVKSGAAQKKAQEAARVEAKKSKSKRR